MKKWTIAFAAALGAISGGALVKKVWLEKYRAQKAELGDSNRERDLLYTWLLLEQKGANPGEYFVAHDFGTIGILGMNREGRRFYEVLRNQAAVSVPYAVELDNFSAVHEHMTVYRLGEDLLPPADCIVICDLARVPEKEEALRREFTGEIVTLAEVLAWLLEAHQIKPWDGAIRDWSGG